ncbi:MAG: hypothetical protein R2797_09395 [Gelidibacter sp.]
MKNLKYLLGTALVVLAIFACSEDDDTVNVDAINPPTNVSAMVRVTSDNSGLVTITPLGEGVANFNLNFGDGSDASGTIQPGSSVNHVYEEGSYDVTIQANGLNGLSTIVNQSIIVSFQAPQNLEVTIENDPTISKQVHVTANADYAIYYEVDFGETGGTPVEGNNGETVSYIYQEAGIYTITVISHSAAIETTTYTEEFEVTAILQPLQAAPAPPSRAESDVISIFSDAYTNLSGTDFYPNWGQSTTFNQITVGGSAIIQYGNLNYEGIQLGASTDASAMEFLHVDIWTADENDAKISPISSGPNETAYDLDLTPQQWTSFNIPLSFFTDQNPLVNFADIIQFKFDGVPAGGTIFVDNLYFYRAPSTPFALAGTWQMAEEAGSLGVGPSVGDTSWWNCDASCVGTRACYYDDTYVFGTDGSFMNNQDAETWIEPWQGGSDACGAPVAPHDGSNPATYTVDQAAGTFTLNGTGAYIGLPKANNQGELPNVSVPSSITYNYEVIDDNTISVYVEAGPGVFWQYKLVRTEAPVSPMAGTWAMASEAGALGVGPAVGDTSWWNCDAGCVSTRACYYDDTYVFGSDGSFTNNQGSETWIEPWQGGADACGAPVAPHDGSNPATFNYDAAAGTVTLNGTGAYLGLPKANNQGELPNVAVPDSITYNVTFVDANTIQVYVEAGPGVFWQYKLVRL